MKTLYLVRHAKSSWKQPDLSDFVRPLNKRGENDAPFMGKLLSDKRVNPDLVISSPAKRASATAKIIASEINFPKEKIVLDDNIYEATGRGLLEIISETEENYKSVMLFGHNPGLTVLQNNLSDHFIDNIPTCGVVALKFKTSWNEIKLNSAGFIFFEYPKKHKY
ncbi:MAG: histidine phosphatase family protein [Candidatus Cloacimonadota bacterium]|nr:MAG: histidine phosphatase family protein [Candidatus Cloacimonadota bacterium]